MYTIFEMMLTRKILDFVIILERRAREKEIACINGMDGEIGGKHTSPGLGNLEEMCKIYVWARPSPRV